MWARTHVCPRDDVRGGRPVIPARTTRIPPIFVPFHCLAGHSFPLPFSTSQVGYDQVEALFAQRAFALASAVESAVVHALRLLLTIRATAAAGISALDHIILSRSAEHESTNVLLKV